MSALGSSEIVDLEGTIAELAPRVLRYANARLGDPALAEDVAQESLAALVRACRNGGAPRSAEAFVFAVARRRAGRAGWRRRLWAPAGPGFVAGGYWRVADRIRQAFWSSADGQSWRRGGTFAPPGGTEEIRDVAALGDGAIAVGLRDPGTANAPAAWASPDGVSWARAAPLPLAAGGEPGTQTVNAVVGGDRLVVAVGWLETTDGERPVAWAAPTQPAP